MQSPSRPQQPSTGLIVLALLFCAPVGLFLMWTRTNWSQQSKFAVTGVLALLLVGGMIYESTPAGKAERAAQEAETARLIEAESQRKAAEAAQKAAQANAERATRANGSEGLTVLLPTLKLTRGKGLPYITGVLENKGRRAKTEIRVEFTIENKNGVQTGLAIAHGDVLGVSERWDFKAIIKDVEGKWKSDSDIPSDALDAYYLTEISSRNYNPNPWTR